MTSLQSSIPGPFYWARTFSYLPSILLLPVLDSIRNGGSFACTGSVLHLLNSVVMWLKHMENNHKWLGVAASPQNYACKCRGHMTCTCWPSTPCLWWHLLQPLEVSGLTYLPAVCPLRWSRKHSSLLFPVIPVPGWPAGTLEILKTYFKNWKNKIIMYSH